MSVYTPKTSVRRSTQHTSSSCSKTSQFSPSDLRPVKFMLQAHQNTVASASKTTKKHRSALRDEHVVGAECRVSVQQQHVRTQEGDIKLLKIDAPTQKRGVVTYMHKIYGYIHDTPNEPIPCVRVHIPMKHAYRYGTLH